MTELTVPSSDDSERAVLGGILIQNDLFNAARPLLQPADFYRPSHQHIWEAMLVLTKDLGAIPPGETPIDVLTLSDQLQSMSRLEECGGPLYVSQLMDGVPRLTNVQHYALVVLDRSKRRSLLHAASDTASRADDTSRTVNELVEGLSGKIDRLKARQRPNTETVLQSIDSFMEGVADSVAGKTPPRGWSTGLISLDAPLGGVVPGRLITIGARPKMGKSSLLLGIGRALAKQGVGMHFQSIEMPKSQLIARIIAQEASVPLMKLVNPHPQNGLSEREWGRVVRASKRLEPFVDHLHVDYSASVTVADIKAAVWAADLRRQEKGLGPIQVVVIDYLQRIRGVNSRLQRREQLAETSWTLAEWAKSEDRAIIVGAQVRRFEGKDYSKKTGLPPRPRASNLKESGSIEEDSDQVILIDRNEVHIKEQEMEIGDNEGKCWFSVGLNRHGPTDDGYIHFWSETVCFTERDHSRAREIW